MKVYVAGVKIDRNHTDQSTPEKTRHIIDLLETIQQDAITQLGKDAVIIVILQEYALTPEAIPADDKRSSLVLLQQAMRDYDQMILIPGSYSSYEKYETVAAQKTKFEKIKSNYQNISLRHIVPTDAYDDEIMSFDNFSRRNKLGNCHFLKNTAYILTALEKHRHVKAAPFYESNKFPLAFTDHVYYIGHDDFIKHLTVHGKKIDAGIFICFEHHKIDHQELLLREQAPLLHTLVSATIDIKTEKLIGALNIQMDKCDGLVVVKNRAHFRANEIEEVVANTYRTGSKKIESGSRVIHIDKPLPISPSDSPDIDIDSDTDEKNHLKRERDDEKDINTRKYKH